MSETVLARPNGEGPPGVKRGLGLAALTAIVVGSMIGSGIFALPSQMAVSAAPGPLLIGWVITGLGMLTLAPPQTSGEVVRVSIPIGELVSRGARTMSDANRRHAERNADERVRKDLERFVAATTTAPDGRVR